MNDVKKLLILDVDTGIDDALAVILALRSPLAEVLAIGTVAGNVSADQAAINTLKVLDVIGAEVPVAVGINKPLFRDAESASSVHGEDGLGEVNLPYPSRTPTGEHAVDQLIRLAHERRGEISLFTSGTLTNVATALIREPRLPHLLKELVIMGGAVGVPGNRSSVAEANIYKDPEAARLVFAQEWPLTMVGLDVTMQTMLYKTHLEQLQESENPLACFASAIIAFYMHAYSRSQGYEACPLHDPLALQILLDRSFVTHMAALDVEVETMSPLTVGMTVADRRSLLGPGYPQPKRPISVPLEVDGERFVAQLMRTLLS